MPTKKRTRASHPKVRTGCHTCKARRVKCDEQRPSCEKCINTGRKCEGYKNNREWIVVVAPQRPVTDGFEDDRSRRHFDYFRTQAVYELSWFFDDDHWPKLVLQESHSSAAVRHAVIALACSHEDFKNNARTAAQAPQYAYAAQHYSKAIKNLIKETSDAAQESRLRALMCGLLFISLETVRGNNAAALHHLDGCLKIVKEAQAQLGMTSLDHDCLECAAHLFRDIIPMCARLDIQASIMLGRQQQNDTTIPECSESANDVGTDMYLEPNFRSSFEALQCLYWLGDRVHDLVGGLAPLHSARPDAWMERLMLEGQFLHWERAIQPLLAASENTHEFDKFLVMRIHHRTMMTLLESSFDDTERLLDNYQWAFEDIIKFAAELQEDPQGTDDESSNDSDSYLTADSLAVNSARSQSSRTSTPLSSPRLNVSGRKTGRPVFVLDAGIIFSLYWTALKCRDGPTRRRAISLLESSKQDGSSIGPIQAAIAKRIVEIEEEQPYEQDPISEKLKRAEDVLGYARVHNVNTDIMREKQTARVMILKRVEGVEEGCQSVEWIPLFREQLLTTPHLDFNRAIVTAIVKVIMVICKSMIPNEKSLLALQKQYRKDWSDEMAGVSPTLFILFDILLQ
ncbi:hypothetical protein CC80DRAFT_535513 [Byssothecium circinans]|uniref:Zn(2)-C6 fungal-type domain-containing protein n=1 Tax=Byssothecium circinans TaxID=147558 RepID=A0A6A5TWP3_9PLEO|nr:hypothetical protein CC80DRAFT_535513 [Byssothecium circinans]